MKTCRVIYYNAVSLSFKQDNNLPQHRHRTGSMQDTADSIYIMRGPEHCQLGFAYNGFTTLAVIAKLHK